MKKIHIRNTLIISFLLFTAPLTGYAKMAKWHSVALNKNISVTISEPSKTAKDYFKNTLTLVYLENTKTCSLSAKRCQKEIRHFLSQGYRVIEMDYRHDKNAVTPFINQDIIAVNDSIASGHFCGLTNCSHTQSYVLFEGYRIMRNVPYFVDDPTVYNTPKEYTQGDTLSMDIIYPAYTLKKVPVILSFSYSNSYATFDSQQNKLTDINKNQRTNLGYTFAGFKDSFLEGASGEGFAWAIADHPKYCPWGKGKRKNGSNDEYKSYESNPDTGQKVKSAIRTLRAWSKKLNLSGKIGIYGFSRGSSAGSMAVGDKKDVALENAGFHQERNDEIQAAILGPGIFDYTLIYDKKNDGDSNLETRCPLVWGKLEDNRKLWESMGSTHLVETSKSAPVLFFYNTTDEISYQDQIASFKKKLDSLNVPTYQLIDYGKGHSVPTKSKDLMVLYEFLKRYL